MNKKRQHNEWCWRNVLIKQARATDHGAGREATNKKNTAQHTSSIFLDLFLWLFAIYDGGNHFWLFALKRRLNEGPKRSAHHLKRRKMMERPSKFTRPPQSTQKREKIQFALEPFLCNNEMKHVEDAEMLRCAMKSKRDGRVKKRIPEAVQ